EDRDLFIAASNSWIVGYDNVSRIPSWLSDALCRLATGGGFSTRKLYTDDEEQLFNAQRPVSLNGIEDFVNRPDLADRTIFLTLDPIPEDRRVFCLSTAPSALMPARCVMLPLCDVVHTQGRPPSLPMKEKQMFPGTAGAVGTAGGSPCLPCGIAALAATGSFAHQSFSSHAGGGWTHLISFAFRPWLSV